MGIRIRACPHGHVHDLHHLVDAAPCASSAHEPHTCGHGGVRSAPPEDAAGRPCVPTATRILAHSQWVGGDGFDLPQRLLRVRADEERGPRKWVCPPLSTLARGACAVGRGAPSSFHVKHADSACARDVAMSRERPLRHAGRVRSAEHHPGRAGSATASASQGGALPPPSGSRMGRFRLHQRR